MARTDKQLEDFLMADHISVSQISMSDLRGSLRIQQDKNHIQRG